MNKRHYEHTLPNIRGSLSNTYDRLWKEERLVYALMNVSCAKSSLNSLSPQVRLRKNRRTGDWYFFTNWSKALVFLNTTTCATSDISLSWLIYFRRSFLRFFLPAALPKGRLCRCLFSGKRSSGKDQHHLFSVVCCLLSIGRCP